MTAALLLMMLAAAPGKGADAPVRAPFEDAVRARLAVGDAAEVAIADLQPAEPELLRRAHRIVAVALPEGERGYGRVTARVTVVPKRGEAPRDTWVVARVDVRVPTAVTTRRVARGERLGVNDVTLALRPLDDGTLSEPALAVGRVARQLLADGEALRPERLELPALVARGDAVQVVVSGRAFRLATRAEALARGAIGASIPVRIAMSGRVLQAIVTGPGQVEVRP